MRNTSYVNRIHEEYGKPTPSSVLDKGVLDGKVCKQIGERDLHIADKQGAEEHGPSSSIAAVITLCEPELDPTTSYHPMFDGPGNDYRDFVAAVEDARAAIREEGEVLIHCAAGISRSSTVMATALAAEEDRDFDEVVVEIRQHRLIARPNPALRALARDYLNEPKSDVELNADHR